MNVLRAFPPEELSVSRGERVMHTNLANVAQNNQGYSGRRPVLAGLGIGGPRKFIDGD